MFIFLKIYTHRYWFHKHQHKEAIHYDDDKIENTIKELELTGSYTKNLLLASGYNISDIINYITAMKTEVNYSGQYGKCKLFECYADFPSIIIINHLKKYHEINIIKFLDSLRKSEPQDPLHKWIGTYNLYRMYLLRFFRWYFSPGLEHGKRPKPAVMENIPKLRRKETSIYKPSDLWSPQDDSLFLTYCPSKRDKCYHAISRDSSARPHEILKLKHTRYSIQINRYFSVCRGAGEW